MRSFWNVIHFLNIDYSFEYQLQRPEILIQGYYYEA
jgi:hypothetical protein